MQLGVLFLPSYLSSTFGLVDTMGNLISYGYVG